MADQSFDRGFDQVMALLLGEDSGQGEPVHDQPIQGGMGMRKLVYFVGPSLDGYIAEPGGEIDFYPLPDDTLAWIGAEYPETLPTHVRFCRVEEVAEKPVDPGR